MKKKLNLAAITIIAVGLCALAFIKLSRYNRNKELQALEQQVIKDTDTTGKYEGLPLRSEVLLPNALTGHIKTIIPLLDTNLFVEGRTVEQASEHDFINKIADHAEASGGAGSGSTFYRNDLLQDYISISLITEYDKSSLKFLKTWKKPIITKDFEYNEPRYAYSGKIKVNYTIVVDGEVHKGAYYTQSQINSPMDLLYK